MSETGTGEGARKPAGIGTMRRKAVDVTKLVETSTIDGNPLPLIVRPAMEGVDLAEWAASHRDEVEAWFDKSTARCSSAASPSTAPTISSASRAPIAGDLFAEYGDLPPEADEPEGVRLDAVSGGQDDPLPQRELASADVADAPVLLLRHSVRERRRRRRCSTRGVVRRARPGDRASSSRRRG